MHAHIDRGKLMFPWRKGAAEGVQSQTPSHEQLQARILNLSLLSPTNGIFNLVCVRARPRASSKANKSHSKQTEFINTVYPRDSMRMLLDSREALPPLIQVLLGCTHGVPQRMRDSEGILPQCPQGCQTSSFVNRGPFFLPSFRERCKLVKALLKDLYQALQRPYFRS